MKGIRYGVAVQYRHTNDREMDERGGVRNPPEFKHYRMASHRVLVSGSSTLADRYTVSGMTGLEMHASECETRDFDPALTLGFDLDVRVYDLPDCPFFVYASVACLTFSAEDGSVTHVAQHPGYQPWGSVDVDWSEFNAAVRVQLDRKKTRLSSGLRFTSVTAESTGTARGRSASGDFEQEDAVGLFVGFEYDLSNGLAGRFRADFVDETAFSAGLHYTF